jgi:sugar phosphate isomerase/epimerase
MRVGVLIAGEIEQLEWADGLAFRSVEWMRFDSGRAGIGNKDWKPFADEFSEAAKLRNIRISAIGAYYRNALDPKQTEYARDTVQRAIAVAAHLGIKNVCGFPGAVIETEWSERGGNTLYKPLEDFMPRVIAFWEPLAKLAADHGVRIAFEHCPQGPYHLPLMHYNIFGQPAMWERFFNDCACENIGIEWDASHLICQFVDPVANIHKFGSRIFHVHAKDAFINRRLLEEYGICHPGVAEHRFPGLGQSNWAEIVHALLRAGYDSDLNIEGRHDPIYRDHNQEQPWDVKSHGRDPLAGLELEETGLLIAKRTLEPLVVGTE